MLVVIGSCGACGGTVALVGAWAAHPSVRQPGTCLKCLRTTAPSTPAPLPTLEMAPQSREIITAQERFAQLAESFGARWKGDSLACVARRDEANDIAAGIRGTYTHYPRPDGYNPIEDQRE